MMDAQKLLCSWGIHRHNKKILFESKDIGMKFLIPICPYCECPKRRYMKLLFPDGRVCIDKKIYLKLINVLKESEMTLYGFTGKVRNLSDSLKESLKSLRKD